MNSLTANRWVMSLFIAASFLVAMVSQSHSTHHLTSAYEYTAANSEHSLHMNERFPVCDSISIANDDDCDKCGSWCQQFILVGDIGNTLVGETGSWQLLKQKLPSLYTSDPVPPPISLS